MLPVIGHTGVGVSEGTIHDFSGPYTISVDNMAFGNPMRYCRLRLTRDEARRWDAAVAAADRTFKKRMHNLCCNNCHHHVAEALNELGYRGRRNWTQVDVFWMMLFRGSFVS
eukprot:GHVU01055279.1.p5 GENE.GHVU01055279.1~~GHVU01055279.1.p5  ORF type:complete len:112 (-),score=15.64 GHVU01055279.1:594-929(-)